MELRRNSFIVLFLISRSLSCCNERASNAIVLALKLLNSAEE